MITVTVGFVDDQKALNFLLGSAEDVTPADLQAWLVKQIGEHAAASEQPKPEG